MPDWFCWLKLLTVFNLVWTRDLKCEHSQSGAGVRETWWSMQGKGKGGHAGSWMSSDSSLLLSPVHLSRCISILNESAQLVPSRDTGLKIR